MMSIVEKEGRMSSCRRAMVVKGELRKRKESVPVLLTIIDVVS